MNIRIQIHKETKETGSPAVDGVDSPPPHLSCYLFELYYNFQHHNQTLCWWPFGARLTSMRVRWPVDLLA